MQLLAETNADQADVSRKEMLAIARHGDVMPRVECVAPESTLAKALGRAETSVLPVCAKRKRLRESALLDCGDATTHAVHVPQIRAQIN